MELPNGAPVGSVCRSEDGTRAVVLCVSGEEVQYLDIESLPLGDKRNAVLELYEIKDSPSVCASVASRYGANEPESVKKTSTERFCELFDVVKPDG